MLRGRRAAHDPKENRNRPYTAMRDLYRNQESMRASSRRSDPAYRDVHETIFVDESRILGARLAPRCRAIVAAGAWFVPHRRVVLGAVARCLRAGILDPDAPGRADEVAALVVRSMRDSIVDQSDEELAGAPLDEDHAFYLDLAVAVGWSLDETRLACVVLNRQPHRVRRAFLLAEFRTGPWTESRGSRRPPRREIEGLRSLAGIAKLAIHDAFGQRASRSTVSPSSTSPVGTNPSDS